MACSSSSSNGFMNGSVSVGSEVIAAADELLELLEELLLLDEELLEALMVATSASASFPDVR